VLGSALISAVIVVALTAGGGPSPLSGAVAAHPLPALVTVLLAASSSGHRAGHHPFIPNADAAPAVVNFTSLPILFISGFFFNFNNAVFEDIAKVFPIYWFKESMLNAFGTEPSSSGWNGQDLLVMLVWGWSGWR